jgi:hypothetical protein
LRAVDATIVLDDLQVRRLQFWILEILPASRCAVYAGPGVEIRVDEREPADLTPTLKAKFEEIIGCERVP